jgi:hypothetical protein
LARFSSPCSLARIGREPTLEEISMTNTLTALVAAATLATAAAGVPTTANARCAGCLVGIGALPPEAPPGYVYYPAYAEPLPGPNCNWFRMPIYDVHGNMVSWRGRPVAFCSWLAGYRPWPLP